MSSPTAQNLRRLASEFVVIVVGVLVALAAQGWWESRQLDDDRTRALRAIGADLALLGDDAAGSIARADTVVASIRWLLESETDIVGASDSLYSHHVQYALWEGVWARVGLPAYEELESSGRLSLLPDDVRSDLARLDDAIRGLDAISDDTFQYQIRNLDPWLLDNAPLRSILDYDQEFGGEFQRFEDGVLRSLRVENMLLAKLELIGNLKRGAASVVALTDRLRDEVGTYLEGP